MNKPFDRRLFGRVAAETIKGKDGKVIVKKNEGIDEEQAKQIADPESGIDDGELPLSAQVQARARRVQAVLRL